MQPKPAAAWLGQSASTIRVGLLLRIRLKGGLVGPGTTSRLEARNAIDGGGDP
jgi:hypothetical protein